MAPTPKHVIAPIAGSQRLFNGSCKLPLMFSTDTMDIISYVVVLLKTIQTPDQASLKSICEAEDQPAVLHFWTDVGTRFAPSLHFF